MPSQPYSDQQVMLGLSLLAYRGCCLAKRDNEQELKRSISAGLREFGPLRGEWTLCWGPASFRFLGSLVDDAMMFLVKGNGAREGQYAIVVRGTNPVALRDWIFFDLLALRQEPWAPGGTKVQDAEISLSTGLGVRTLLNMRAESDLSVNADAPCRSRPGPGARRAKATAVRATMRPIKAVAQATVGLRQVALQLGAASRVLDWIGDAGIDLLKRILELEIAYHDRRPDEPDLVGMLQAVTHGARDKIDLFVTGHSKGGALASAIALHLADTRERGRAWDPQGVARIHCYSFAAPTVGNEQFADHSKAAIGCEHLRRFANRLDIVPRAWIPTQIEEVPGLYGAACGGSTMMEPIARVVARSVEGLGYRHAVDSELGGEDRIYARDQSFSFFIEALLQHVVAYVDRLKLGDVIEVADLLEQMGQLEPGKLDVLWRLLLWVLDRAIARLGPGSRRVPRLPSLEPLATGLSGVRTRVAAVTGVERAQQLRQAVALARSLKAVERPAAHRS